MEYKFTLTGEALMKCRVCGYELDPNREYCDVCGTKVAVSNLSTNAKEVPVAGPLNEQKITSLELIFNSR